MTTNITKKTATPSAIEETAPDPLDFVGPPLRHAQVAETVTFAHHLRVGAKEVMPGDTAQVSPDYARQLRASGYVARTRGRA
ncbi:hypothetical protein OG723_44165 (plasmid) [Streptomyces sp. NBC_01278]|uniref:hypothetical protein n=1 Tax=Streptomyces sp. NBC_01278 TaxID=2903809 RepID=UPI002E36B74E|nr:hypothetical protein [Streptomyces sp. NBC_01278]